MTVEPVLRLIRTNRHSNTTTPMHTGNYSRSELLELGFAAVGERVAVDRSVQVFGADRIHVGSDVRIDAFCVLSAGSRRLALGNHIHLASGVRVLGGDQVTLEDFCGISAGVCIFGSSDDYSGGALTNPTVPDEYRNVTTGPVLLKRHTIVGANSVIMPNVTLGVACSVGALTFVNKSVPDFAIVSGNPMRKVGTRSESILQRERDFLDSDGHGQAQEHT